MRDTLESVGEAVVWIVIVVAVLSFRVGSPPWRWPANVRELRRSLREGDPEWKAFSDEQVEARRRADGAKR